MLPNDPLVLTFEIFLVVAIGIWIYRAYIGWSTPFFHPVESNVDRYLDVKFEEIIEKWELVNTPRLSDFKKRVKPRLDKSANKVSELREYKKSLNKRLDSIEKRVDVIA